MSCGKFANGAVTGAFSYLYNGAAHEGGDVDKAGRKRPGPGFVKGPTGYWQLQAEAEVELMYGANGQMSLAPVPSNTQGARLYV